MASQLPAALATLMPVAIRPNTPHSRKRFVVTGSERPSAIRFTAMPWCRMPSIAVHRKQTV